MEPIINIKIIMKIESLFLVSVNNKTQGRWKSKLIKLLIPGNTSNLWLKYLSLSGYKILQISHLLFWHILQSLMDPKFRIILYFI